MSDTLRASVPAWLSLLFMIHVQFHDLKDLKGFIQHMFGQYVQWEAGWRPLESVAKRKNNLKSSQMFNNGSILSRLPRVSASQHCRHRVSAPLLSSPRITFDVIRPRSRRIVSARLLLSDMWPLSARADGALICRWNQMTMIGRLNE